MALQENLERLLGRFDGAVNTSEIARAIERGGRRRLEELLDAAWATLTPALQAELQSAVVSIATPAFAAGWREATSRPVPPPTAIVRYARGHAARRVTGMSAAGRRAIRQLVTGALAGGAASRTLAVELVRAGLPLNRVQAGALRKFHDRLQRQVDEGDLDARRAARRVVKESDRMRRVRARAIARTERRNAQGWARQRSWDTAIERGLIRERDWQKVWHTTPDDRLSDVCMPLNGQRAPVRGSFSDGTERPPRHPNCRCTVTLRRRS